MKLIAQEGYEESINIFGWLVWWSLWLQEVHCGISTLRHSTKSQLQGHLQMPFQRGLILYCALFYFLSIQPPFLHRILFPDSEYLQQEHLLTQLLSSGYTASRQVSRDTYPSTGKEYEKSVYTQLMLLSNAFKMLRQLLHSQSDFAKYE